MTDLDQRIDQTLREHAEGSVDTDRLLAGAVTRGRARVRRRRTVAGTALGMVAVLGVGMAVGPADLPGAGLDGVLPGLGRPADAVASAVPPRADGVPGAAARPDQVGADPNVLHFGFAPGRLRYLYWSVTPGVETAQLDVGGRAVTLELAASAEALPGYAPGLPGSASVPVGKGVFDGSVSQAALVDDKPVWLRHWQPAPGVYARATVTGEDRRGLFDVATALRLDQAYRCGGPLRLTTLPADARVTSCDGQVASFPSGFQSRLVVTRGVEAQIFVELQYGLGIVGNRTEGNRTIGGRPAYRSGPGAIELLGFPKAHLTAHLGFPDKGFTDDDVATVLGGAQVAEPLDDPSAW
ncbi:hypothetical protein ACFOW4_15710 [Micromonospora sp. GCM10011542]|uniref:hypothetical protein n=1 Tax=Micromonospora sp. GCM10011542 TaxID=3317337 RepID=UPI0036091F96